MRRHILFPIGLLSLALFVELGLIAKSGPLAIDKRVALWFKAHRTPTQVHWANVISILTRPVIVLVVMVLLLLYLNYRTRSWNVRNLIPLALVFSSAVLAALAKSYFHRLRPGMGLSTQLDLEPSFPSSHTVFIAAAGSSLFFYVVRRHVLALVGVGLATCLMGLVRLTVGVHWFTDVVGSFLLSLGMLILFYVLDGWLAEKEGIGP